MEFSSHIKSLVYSQINDDIKKMGPHYLDHRILEIREMLNLIKLKDYITIDFICHKINGSAAGFGFPTLTEIAIQIQDQIEKKSFENIPKLINEMEVEVIDLYECCLNTTLPKSIFESPENVLRNSNS